MLLEIKARQEKNETMEGKSGYQNEMTGRSSSSCCSFYQSSIIGDTIRHSGLTVWKTVARSQCSPELEIAKIR